MTICSFDNLLVSSDILSLMKGAKSTTRSSTVVSLHFDWKIFHEVFISFVVHKTNIEIFIRGMNSFAR